MSSDRRSPPALPHPEAQAAPTRRQWLRSATALVGAPWLAGLGACTTEEDETALLRFVNATASVSSADFWIDSSVAVAALAYGGYGSSWQTVDATTVQTALHSNGSSTAKFTSSHDYSADSYTTIVAMGNASSSDNALTFKYLTETESSPSSSKVKLRVLHADSVGEPRNVFVVASDVEEDELASKTPSFSEDDLTGMGSLSEFVTFSASTTWRIWVTDADGDVLFSSDTVNFGGATVATLVLAANTASVAVLLQKDSAGVLANQS